MEQKLFLNLLIPPKLDAEFNAGAFKNWLEAEKESAEPRFYFITELEDFSAYEVNPHGLVNNSFCCFAFFHRRLNNIPKRKGRRQAGKRNRSDAQ